MVQWLYIAKKRRSLVWFSIIKVTLLKALPSFQIIMIFSKVFFVLGEHVYIAGEKNSPFRLDLE
jgi:hypothetical protein